jgi:hypothetical protein
MLPCARTTKKPLVNMLLSECSVVGYLVQFCWNKERDMSYGEDVAHRVLAQYRMQTSNALQVSAIPSR